MKKKLKDVCDFYSGTGFPTQYQGEIEGDYPFYKVGDIANNATTGKIYLELCNNYISKDIAKTIKGCILPKDTVVFAKIGEALKLNRRAITSCECLIDNNAMGIAPKINQLRIQYFFFFMKNLKMQSLAESTTVPSVRKTKLENYEIEVPSMEAQEEIEKKLALILDIIEKRKQELVGLDSLIKARFIELFGDPIVNSMSWPEELIGDSCFVTKLAGFEYTQYIHYKDSGDVVMVKAQNVKNGKLNRKDLSYISKAVSDSLPRSQLLAGDVVMTYVGANIGDVAVIDDKYKYHLAPNVAKIRPNAEKYNSIYFMYMLMFLNSYIVGNSADTAKAALGMERIRKLKIFVPPIELQEQFAAFVEQVDKSKVAIQKSLEKTQLLFDSLMQKYFG